MKQVAFAFRFFCMFLVFSLLLNIIEKRLYAQNNHNSVTTRAFRYNEAGNTVSSTLESTSYFDGLGRTQQSQVRDNEAGNIIASQVVYDAFGRPALQTLPAPIGSSSFGFHDDFLKNASGADYSYQDFDLVTGATNTRENPSIVNSSSTLGAYYDDNNTSEAYVPDTDFPYYRSTVTQHGVSRAAAPGEELRMGSGHEVMSATFPVLDELNHYIQFRDDFFASGVPAETSLKYQAFKRVTIDQNGQVAITFFDRQGNLIATALSGYKLIEYSAFQHTPITNSSAGNPDFVKGEVDETFGFIDIYVPHYADFQISNGHSNQIEVWDMATDQQIYSGAAGSFSLSNTSASVFLRIVELNPGSISHAN